MSDEHDLEARIREQTDEACDQLVKMGGYELPSAKRDVRRRLNDSAKALTPLDPGFAFLPEPEQIGFGEESKILIEKLTALPEPDPDTEVMARQKPEPKRRAFMTTNFGLLVEYSFW